MEYSGADLPDTANIPGDIHTTPSMRQNWYAISRWSLFFAIMGCVLIGLMLLGVSQISKMLPMMAYALGENPILDAMTAMGAVFVGIIVLILAVLILINFWQFQFATQLKRSVTHTDQESFEQSWMNYRNLFRAVGIVTVLFLALVIGLIAFAYSLSR